VLKVLIQEERGLHFFYLFKKEGSGSREEEIRFIVASSSSCFGFHLLCLISTFDLDSKN